MTKQCENPECQNIIPEGRALNARYCTAACRRHARYLANTKKESARNRRYYYANRKEILRKVRERRKAERAKLGVGPWGGDRRSKAFRERAAGLTSKLVR
jgi:hypothetical protein